MPSLRYSVFGSLLVFTKGSTAIDEMSLLPLLSRRKKNAATMMISSAAAPIAAKSNVRLLPFCCGGEESAIALICPEVESRRNRFRSASISAALW
jgi:hypothetical protein